MAWLVFLWSGLALLARAAYERHNPRWIDHALGELRREERARLRG